MSNSKRKFIQQTKTGKGGNCMSACLATLLECHIDDVPNDDSDKWQDILNEWLIENHGVHLVTVRLDEPVNSKMMIDYFTGSIVIGVGKRTSEAALLHAVLYQDGNMIFDPHPGGNGVIEATEIDMLVKHYK